MSQADATAALAWLASLPSAGGTLLTGHPDTQQVLEAIRARARAISWLQRATRWERSFIELPRREAEYLAARDAVAVVTGSLAGLAVALACREALRGRGRPRRTDAQGRVRIARALAGVIAVDDRERRRLRAELRRLDWLAERTAGGGTLLTGRL